MFCPVSWFWLGPEPASNYFLILLEALQLPHCTRLILDHSCFLSHVEHIDFRRCLDSLWIILHHTSWLLDFIFIWVLESPSILYIDLCKPDKIYIGDLNVSKTKTFWKTTKIILQKTQNRPPFLNRLDYLHQIWCNAGEHANKHACEFLTRYSQPSPIYTALKIYSSFENRSEKRNFNNLRPLTF